MTDHRQAELIDPATCDVVDLLNEHSQLLPPAQRWPSLLRELFDVLTAYNQSRLLMTPAQAADDASERVVCIADYLGGRWLYLPKGETLRDAARQALIYRLADSQSADQLARRFKLSTMRIYQILAEQRAIEVDARQGKLFDATGREPEPSRNVAAQ